MIITILITLMLILAPAQILADTHNNVLYYQIGEASRTDDYLPQQHVMVFIKP
jgi:hypothetical protein